MPPVSRRRFLAGGGALALGLGLAPATVMAQRRPARRRRPGASDRAWRVLASSLDGRLLLPHDPGFVAIALPWNLAYAQQQPAAIALVESAFDVQRCVAWARGTGLPVAPLAEPVFHAVPATSM